MELLLYAIRQNFVLVLYASVAQIIGRELPFSWDTTRINPKGHCTDGNYCLGPTRKGNGAECHPDYAPGHESGRFTHKISSRTGHVSATEIDSRPLNAQRIRIDIRQDLKI
jgi:hypothetical protein